MDILHILHRLSDITLGAGLVLFSLYRKKNDSGYFKRKDITLVRSGLYSFVGAWLNSRLIAGIQGWNCWSAHAIEKKEQQAKSNRIVLALT